MFKIPTLLQRIVNLPFADETKIRKNHFTFNGTLSFISSTLCKVYPKHFFYICTIGMLPIDDNLQLTATDSLLKHHDDP